MRRCDRSLLVSFAGLLIASGLIVSVPAGASGSGTDDFQRLAPQPRTSSFDDTYVEAGEINVTSNPGAGISSNPASLAIDTDDDTVYVANSYMGTVEEIAPGQLSGSTLRSVQVLAQDAGDSERGLFGIAVDSDDDTVYVVDRKYNPKRLWSINPRTFTVDDTVILPCDNSIHNGRAYLDIAVNSVDDTVYVPCNPNSGGARGRIVALAGANLDDSGWYDNSSSVNGSDIVFSGVTIDPRDDTVYAGGWWGPSEVEQMTASPFTYAGSLTGGLNQPQGLAILDDTLYVSNWDTTSLAAFGLLSGSAASVSLPDKEAADLAVDGNRRLIFVASNTQRVWLLSAPDLTLRQTFTLSGFKAASVIVSSRGLAYVGSNGSNAGVKVFGPAEPGVPTSVSGTPGYEQVVVSWTAPTYTGASAIKWYRVTANPGSNTCIAQAPVPTCVVGGLTAGTPYTFVVQAMNSTGVWGPTSASSAAVAPLAPPTPGPGPGPTPTPIAPGVPRDASATAGDERARVTWAAPTYAGSSPISVYRVTASPGGETCFVDAPSTACTVRDLINGTPYAFRVQALNEGGWSQPATTSLVTPQGHIRPRITLDPGERTTNGINDLVSTRGETTGIPAGSRLTPYVRSSREATYKAGVADVVVSADGSFTWSREVRKSKPLFAYMVYESEESNTVVWVRLSGRSGTRGR